MSGIMFFRGPSANWHPRPLVAALLILVLLASWFLAVHDSDHQTYLTRRGSSATDISSNVNSLFARDDYSCAVGRPCSNGACCGKTGFCNYDNVTCGNGCISNCNAKAECGQWAKTPGQKCPLNTCCSEFGFCGTTTDFCSKSKKCQSNCVEHPSPPGGGKGDVLKRVIGYYEAWNAASKCHPVAPEDLPLDALTHVNYAFAYIDPKSLKITTMDSTVSKDLFKRVSALKTLKPDLRVAVSIGGWTFSDNDSVTQPLFGEIAGDENKRNTFARNLVSFLTEYDYDGVDIDWEYPGAPDRGGKTADVKNYVTLLKTLRTILDSSPRKLDLTFTAPSSYWYLRWFDMPGLMKYADWVNVMTYDLHGVWDATNPIGAIVQGHTNLTEIQLAMELLWRVDVSPSQVAMGFGFYGRSFKLADPSCTTPGCPFDPAGADKGLCTGTSGYLSHYEIKDILDGKTSSGKTKRAAPKPVYDKKAGVNYVVFNGDQWVSYDDEVTFKQKVEWGNKNGLSGSLIWASDLDDTGFGAHAGLLGRKIADPLALAQKAAQVASANAARDLTGQDCEIEDYCIGRDNNVFNPCPRGRTLVGWSYQKDLSKGSKYQEKCSSGSGHPICCPTTTNFKKCTWRGNGNPASNGGDCNGQCHEGEINVMDNKWGGWSSEGNQWKCGRGTKLFCCESPQWDAITHGCYWSGCGDGCKDGEEELTNNYSDCWLSKKKKYCCAKPAALSQCRWIPGSIWDTDCVGNKCSNDEIEIARDAAGDGSGPWPSCYWGRKRAACCKIALQTGYNKDCTYDVCLDIDCDDEAYDWDNAPSVFQSSKRRDSELLSRATGPPDKPPSKSTGARNPRWGWMTIAAQAFAMWIRNWPSRGTLYGDSSKSGYPGNGKGKGVSQKFYTYWPSDQQSCGNSRVRGIPFQSWTDNDKSGVPRKGETEHVWPKGAFFRFAEQAANGKKPYKNNEKTASGSVSSDFMANRWAKANSLPNNLPVVGRGTDGNGAGCISPRSGLDRMGEAIGSNDNRRVFLLADRALNSEKNLLENLNDPVAQSTFNTLVSNAINSPAGLGAVIRHIGAPVRVSNYLAMDDGDESPRRQWQQVYADALQEARRIEEHDPTAANLAAQWAEFNGSDGYWRVVETRARQWMRARIEQVRAAIANAEVTPSNAADMLGELRRLEHEINNVKWPSPLDATTG